MTMSNILPVLSRVNSLLSYDPLTGEFQWKATNCAGKPAGYLNLGYRRIQIDGVAVMAHRLAWLVTYGCSPDAEIDHVNGVKHDNRIINLRLATRSENQRNIGRRANNSSGVSGVSFNNQSRKWRSYIRINNKLIHLGGFNTFEEAVAARHKAEVTTFEDFRYG